MIAPTVAQIRPVGPATAEAKLYHVAFRSMGCAMGAWVLTQDEAAAEERLNLVRMWMGLVDARLSRFQPDSELGRLNVSPGRQVGVSTLLWDALAWALQAAEETGGLYDPTVLDALVTAGYERDFDEMLREEAASGAWPSPTEDRESADEGLQMGVPQRLPATRRLADTQHTPGRWGPPVSWRTPVSWRMIERDAMHRTVILPPGLRLDLGGTAKGWAAARAADMLVSLGPCLVDAGGDLAVRGSLPGMDGWPIGIVDPDDDEAPLATIIVRDRGVATSGVDYRRWISNGVVQHHIIDPRTGYPAATDLRTATVVAPDAATADLYALVVMVLGRAPGLVLLDEHADLDGVLVDQAGRRWQTSGMDRYLYER